MEVCRQFTKAVILVLVGFSYINLVLHYSDFVTVFITSAVCHVKGVEKNLGRG